ncbi:hypothetical protein SKAU_G00399090 [Synaphobranchus kaupii]|uniref:Uncharacterized protein n=1 Tax=Synaphobranchus kaupii TaxID=118154 RepID=A0A9Q1E8P2_SYNKA|nr:hypothetical protein SKAU_G00399090 [Synaphobranchus kaupii]
MAFSLNISGAARWDDYNQEKRQRMEQERIGACDLTSPARHDRLTETDAPHNRASSNRIREADTDGQRAAVS